MSSPRISSTIVHYGQHNPLKLTGGVETFARNLGIAFEEVVFMTPETRDERLVLEKRWPVICDNQHVLDWPEHIPVIGFQHGVALRKLLAISTWDCAELAYRQFRASRRPRTLWVACAAWIRDLFARMHGRRAEHIVYHAVDLDRFDGRLDNQGSRLVLHDGRTPHKGRDLYPRLSKAFPDYDFQPLACSTEQVPERMRKARAFLHLSLYEGNSIVCNEAMAMDLPCLFTKVGLLLDRGLDLDVATINTRKAFRDPDALVETVRRFLSSLNERAYHPRRWVAENASVDENRRRWQAVIDDFEARSWWP